MSTRQKVITTMRVVTKTDPETYIHADIEEYLNEGWTISTVTTSSSPAFFSNEKHLATIIISTFVLEKR